MLMANNLKDPPGLQLDEIQSFFKIKRNEQEEEPEEKKRKIYEI